MANASIKEIKTIIRGLLVSSPEEVTVSKLRRDFRAQEGQDIPFYEFGFHDVTSFLRSMPDVCQINGNSDGPYAIVRLVESMKSAHVSSLVLRQKVTSKGRRRHSSVPNRGRPPRFSFTPVANYFKNNNGHRSLRSEFPENGYLPASAFNFSSSQGMSNFNNNLPTLPVYNSVHLSCNGYSNKVESWLGGNEEESVLQETYPCPSEVIESESEKLEAIVDHQLQEILISDEGILLQDLEEYLRDVLSAYDTHHANLSADDLEQILRKIPYVRIVDKYVYHEQFMPVHDSECAEQLLELHNLTESTADNINGTLEVESSKSCGKGELSANASTFVPHGNNEKVQRLEHNLYALMKDHVHGILGSELKEKYKMKFAAPLNFQTLGCESTQDLPFKMPHIFSYIRLENGDFKLFPSGHPTEEALKNSKEVALSKVLVVPEITKRNVQWLMQGYPNGLNCRDFEQTYKDTFLESIELKQIGMSSFEEFLHSMEELNIIKIQVTNSDTWIFPTNNSVNLTVFENPLPAKEIIENEVDIKKIKERFPRDVVGPDIHVKQVDIPSWIMKGSLIEILVQEVNNPHHFWVTFCGEQYSRALDSLMDDLQAFYCSKSHSYRMPQEFIREGQDCVTQYVEEWHRARVTSIISATEVEVCFYDYGTRRVVQKNNIHYLHTAHSALPAQAIRAVLANIAPVGDKWTQDASKRFLQLIANKALIGIVISADCINRVFSLFLCDTSGDDDIYIHEVLVSEGYAIETTIDFNEKESNKIEVNNLEREGIVKNENEAKFTLEKEEDEESPPDKSHGNSDGYSKLFTALNNNNHDDASQLSDTVQELQSQNTSRISSQSSLPYAMKKDCLDHSQSISKSVCLDGTSMPTDISATAVAEAVNNSSGLRQKSAPPPGFSYVSKCEPESDASDKTESHTVNNSGVNYQSNENQPCKTESESSKVQTSHDNKSCEKEDHLTDTKNEKVDHGATVKGVSSGVNADFSNVKAPYFQNYYAYSNWPSVPQTFPNFPVMPSPFPPVNALAPLSLGPYNPIPNPLEICNMWYYEQFRQQAFLQGMLAHQQMASSAFPPLPPPGLYLPQNYSAVSSRNHMNISEVHSPELSPSMKSDSKENASACQDACINVETQTEVASSGERSDTKLIQGTSSVEVSSLVKEVDFVPSECGSRTNNYELYLLKSQSKSDFQLSVNTCDYNPDAVPYSGSAIEVSTDEAVTKDTKENSIICSAMLTNVQNNQDVDKCKQDLELRVNSQRRVVDLTVNSSPLKDALENRGSPNSNDSLSKIKNDKESGNLEEQSTKEHAVQNSCMNRPSVDVHTSEDLHNDEKTPSQNTLKSQRECNSKTEENGILPHGRNIHNLHHLDEYGTTKMKSGLKLLQNVDNHSDKESGNMEIEEQEIAQVVFTDIPNEEEIDLHEDDYHENEMIEKAQQECVMNSCAGNNSSATENKNREKKAIIHSKLLSREHLNVIKEEKPSSEVLSCTQSSIYQKYSFESNEKKKYSGSEKECKTKDWLDKFEVTTDHLLEQEHLLSVPQTNSCRSSEISSLNHNSYQVPQKLHSLSETLRTEFGGLSVSNKLTDSSYGRQFVQQKDSQQEHPRVNIQEPDIYNNLSKGEERIVNSVCKAQINLSKQVHPVVGAKLSSEVSASFISGPTQPAMSQKTDVPLAKRTRDPSKDNVPSDSLLSSQSASWRTTWSMEELSRTSTQRPVGRDSLRNSPFRSSSNQNPANWHKENSSGKRGTSFQFVKKIFLCNKKIHQINLDGRPYVITDEIVDNFTPFNGRHVILKILEARKVEINFLELSRRRRPELFESLDKSDIVCRGLMRGPTGNVMGSIHIVPLRSVPYMLRALNKDDEALSNDVKEEMEKFDPSDPYWSGCCG